MGDVGMKLRKDTMEVLMTIGIITAGLMFTHGRFSELAGELNEKSPDYLSGTLSLEKVQIIGNNLLALRKTFSHLETQMTVEEEKNLYRKVVEKDSLLILYFLIVITLLSEGAVHLFHITALAILLLMIAKYYEVYKKNKSRGTRRSTVAATFMRWAYWFINC
jgi:hypothetical protein